MEREKEKMSKELTPLEWLNYYKKKLQVSGQTIRPNGFDIIETALKEKENIEKTINELFSENGKVITTIEIKKKLKALKIIKEKSVDVNWLLQCFTHTKELENYNQDRRHKITEKEYDLLKEVLV